MSKKKKKGLWVCDYAGSCYGKTCSHIKAHSTLYSCIYDSVYCEYAKTKVKCIPYKPQEEEMEKKYETTDKVITRMAVYDELPKDCDEAKLLYSTFDTKFRAFGAFDPIPYQEIREGEYKRRTNRLYRFLQANPRALEWAVEVGFLREVEPEVFYHRGDRFRHDDGEEFILSSLGHIGMALISLNDGNYWHNVTQVNDVMEVTRREFNSITDDRASDFTKIE